MAWTLLTISGLDAWEKVKLCPTERLFVSLHEEHHKRHWWRLRSKRDEREAQAYAVRKMIRLGFTLEECERMMIDYRFLAKYGMRYEEFKEYLKARVY